MIVLECGETDILVGYEITILALKKVTFYYYFCVLKKKPTI